MITDTVTEITAAANKLFLDLLHRPDLADSVAANELMLAGVAVVANTSLNPNFKVCVRGVIAGSGPGAILTREPTFWLGELLEPLSEATRDGLGVMATNPPAIQIFSQARLNEFVREFESIFGGAAPPDTVQETPMTDKRNRGPLRPGDKVPPHLLANLHRTRREKHRLQEDAEVSGSGFSTSNGAP